MSDLPDWVCAIHGNRRERILVLDAADGTTEFRLGNVLTVSRWNQDFWVYFRDTEENITQIRIPFIRWRQQLSQGPCIQEIRLRTLHYIPMFDRNSTQETMLTLQMQFYWNLFVRWGLLQCECTSTHLNVLLHIRVDDIPSLVRLFD